MNLYCNICIHICSFCIPTRIFAENPDAFKYRVHSGCAVAYRLSMALWLCSFQSRDTNWIVHFTDGVCVRMISKNYDVSLCLCSCISRRKSKSVVGEKSMGKVSLNKFHILHALYCSCYFYSNQQMHSFLLKITKILQHTNSCVTDVM
jgi:hypothetical protein